MDIYTIISNGKPTKNKDWFDEVMSNFEGQKVIITVKKMTKKRSEQQNSYYWAVIIPIGKQAIKDQWGEMWSSERVHNYLLDECPIHKDYTNKETGEVRSVKKRSSEMTTEEMNHFWDLCAMFLLENFGVEVPPPQKQMNIFE